MYIYIYIYIYRVNPGLTRYWRSQDILSLPGFCARLNPCFTPSTSRIAHAIAILLHDDFAKYDLPPTPLVVCMPYNIQYWYWQYRVRANFDSVPSSITPFGISPLEYSLLAETAG